MSKVLSALCLLPTLVMAALIINCWDCTQATITLFGVVRCMLNNQLLLKQKYIIIIFLHLEQMERNLFNINKNRHCYIIFSISLLFASSFSQTLVIFLGRSPLVCLALQGGSSCWPSKFGEISFADMWNRWRTLLKRPAIQSQIKLSTDTWKKSLLQCTAFQWCERTSIQFKGENYTGEGVKKGTWQQNQIVWTMTCLCNQFSHWRSFAPDDSLPGCWTAIISIL